MTCGAERYVFVRPNCITEISDLFSFALAIASHIAHACPTHPSNCGIPAFCILSFMYPLF